MKLTMDMNSQCSGIVLVVAMLLLGVCGVLASEGKPEPLGGHKLAPEPVENSAPAGVKAFYNLQYLPKGRYSGDPTLRGDFEMLLDMYLPEEGDGPFPVLFNVHGGAYAAGSKGYANSKGGSLSTLVTTAVKHGYAVANLNYILTPKDIVPQVWYDAQDAVRFLRSKAKHYKLDPTRIGGIGWSAGGWLLSTVGYLGGDDVICGLRKAISMEELASSVRKSAWTYMPKKPPPGLGFVHPAWNPEPYWPEYSGQLQAIAFDFSSHKNSLHASSPAVNQIVGVGFRSKESAVSRLTLAAKVDVPYTFSELTSDKYRGKATHCPNMNEPCLSMDGKGEVTLAERVIQFFNHEFGPEGKAPVPEIRPFVRIIDDRPVEVSIVAAAPSISIHYTVDGTDPTPASPVYDKPFTIQGKVVIKALATISGRRPSGVVTATFRPGPVPPRITAPLTVSLPPATLGKPYSVTFSADIKKVAWRLSGEIRPQNPPRAKSKMVDWMGLSLDPDTGVLSGTPKSSGTYWVAIQVARGPWQLATLRNYQLTVHGPGGPNIGPIADAKALEDPYVKLAVLSAWSQKHVKGLVELLTKAGCDLVSQGEEGEVMIVVRGKHLPLATKLAKEFARQVSLTLEIK